MSWWSFFVRHGRCIVNHLIIQMSRSERQHIFQTFVPNPREAFRYWCGSSWTVVFDNVVDSASEPWSSTWPTEELGSSAEARQLSKSSQPDHGKTINSMNRKGFLSLQLQVICDMDMQVTDLFCGIQARSTMWGFLELLPSFKMLKRIENFCFQELVTFLVTLHTL